MMTILLVSTLLISFITIIVYDKDFAKASCKYFLIFIFFLMLLLSLVDKAFAYENYNDYYSSNDIRILESYNTIIPMNPRLIIYTVNLSYIYDIDPDLVFALIWNESNFDSLAKNKNSSASGFSQMLKSTAISCNNKLKIVSNYNHKIHAFDPYVNLQLMIFYISECIKGSNYNIDRAILAYRGCKDMKYLRLVKSRIATIQRNKNKTSK